MKRNTIFIILLALVFLPLSAQKKKKVVVKKKPVVEEPVEDPKVTAMLASTQQIVFIDSIVVDKPDFLEVYQLNNDAGTLYTYNEFFSTDSQPYSTVYVNQLANKCWFANSGRLYTSDWLNSKWSEPALLEGLGRYQRTNYPFLLSDGTTIYFAAIGEEGLGGLDIYMSRYDSESGTFLRAENIGMPFNSEANDYMYVIDELDSIGYFATDRRQPEGRVCIYTFIPNQSRRTYSTDDYDDATIRSRAAIRRIADTWGNGDARKRALARLSALKKRTHQQSTASETVSFSFVINDRNTYSRLSDFIVADNRDRMNELLAMQMRMGQLSVVLSQNRDAYALASPSERADMTSDILSLEQEYYQLEQNIRTLEKMIRNTENQALK